MHLKERLILNLKGHLNIKTMENEVLIDQDNLIVNNSKTVLSSCLAGSPSADFISYVGFGNGTTSPVLTDAQLGNQIHQIDVSYKETPRPFFIDSKDVNGNLIQSTDVVFSGVVDGDTVLTGITEAGLFSVKEFMFSRLLFEAPISKTAGSAWLVTWTLEI